MIGEKLYEIIGKVTGERVLRGEALGDVMLEVSFQGTGRIFGLDTIESGTYKASMKAPGALYAEGQGLSLTTEGEGVTWHGTGVGRPTGKGMAAHWRGAIYYTTQAPKLARLNTMAVVFEWDIDEHGNARGTTWEWK